ncbi:MAG: hypothetical protein RSC95_06915 [Anaerovoracaceae bacterium]
MKLIKGIVGSALLVSSAILFATKYIVAVKCYKNSGLVETIFGQSNTVIY